MFKSIDLFAGTGGFTLALESLKKYKTVLANDILSSSKAIFNQNFPNIPFICDDIHSLNVNGLKADILTAGFPCQPFSIAGERKGFEDIRSNVFWRMLEIVDTIKPSVLFLENVKNLKGHDKGKTYQIIEKSLQDKGYSVSSKVLNTCSVSNIPQNRERIYLICLKNKRRFEFPDFPLVENYKNIFENNVPQKYYYSPRSSIWEKIKGIEIGSFYQYRRFYLRENKSSVCPTLTANMGTGGHNVPLIKDKDGKIRKLTPRECFRLQGFPDEYQFPEGMSDRALYSLAGNAVSVKVIRKIAEQINPLF